MFMKYYFEHFISDDKQDEFENFLNLGVLSHLALKDNYDEI